LELLKCLYPSASPTFYHFPHNEPPERVLDLGCGLEGRWVLEAATHWYKHQTKVTGFDVVKPEEWKVDDEIKNTARFKQGNLFVRFIHH
jgi:ubiquinone/menaquinone biosynthesis C-methylase UbiE